MVSKVVRVAALLASGTLWTGGTQSFGAPRYPEDWRDSVLSACGLAGLSLLEPPGTPRTGGTQFFGAPRYPGDWRDSVLSAPRYPVD